MNARQFFQHLRSTVLVYDDPTTTWSHESAPVSPNVWSDGGVKSPTNHLWALGSFGVTWPYRSLTAHPFSASENEYAFNQSGPAGLDLWGPIPGYRCSSTRAELMGGIASLMAPGPIHLGVDSQAFLNKAVQLLNAASNLSVVDVFLGHVFKPWPLQRDGDLWRIFWNLLLAKGPHAVRFSKVKGHATAADVAAGISTATDRMHNSRADDLVHRGVKANIEGLAELGSLLGKHQQVYAELMRIIHDFFHLRASCHYL